MADYNYGQQQQGYPQQYPPPPGPPQGYPNQQGPYNPGQSQPYAQPYQAPENGYKSEKGTGEYERFKPKKRINDPIFLVLFLAQVCRLCPNVACRRKLTVSLQFAGFVVVSAIAIKAWIGQGGLGGGVGGKATGSSVTLDG